MKHNFCFKMMLAMLLVTSAGFAQIEKDQSKLTLSLALEMEEVSAPQLSPDGGQIIYTRQWVEKLNDSRVDGRR